MAASSGFTHAEDLGPGHHSTRRHVEDRRGAAGEGDQVGGRIPAPVAKAGGGERQLQPLGLLAFPLLTLPPFGDVSEADRDPAVDWEGPERHECVGPEHRGDFDLDGDPVGHRAAEGGLQGRADEARRHLPIEPSQHGFAGQAGMGLGGVVAVGDPPILIERDESVAKSVEDLPDPPFLPRRTHGAIIRGRLRRVEAHKVARPATRSRPSEKAAGS